MFIFELIVFHMVSERFIVPIFPQLIFLSPHLCPFHLSLFSLLFKPVVPSIFFFEYDTAVLAPRVLQIAIGGSPLISIGRVVCLSVLFSL